MYKKDIKNFTIEELKKELSGIREASYRAGQIFDWIYKKGIRDFGSMANIPRPLQDKLNRLYCLGSLRLKEHIKASDGTEKFLFELSDGCLIETVFIRAGTRRTICLSTQVGCKYACSFCASGLKGFKRNLMPSEILDQILIVQNMAKGHMTNFVFMGMGEPMDNYENVTKAIRVMNYNEGLGVGARRITISTCGIVPGIEKLKYLGIQINLSISLHATNDKLRDSLMPVNKKYPLTRLSAACEDFVEKTHRRITLEYVLIKGKNDSLKDAQGLSDIAKRLKANVNLIPYSPVPNKRFTAPSKNVIEVFKKALTKKGIEAIIRESKGKDIHAACGQLAMRSISR